MQQHDEDSVLVFTTPGMSQLQVIAKLANTSEVAAMTSTIVDLANRAKLVDSRKEMKLILHSQIAMLNSLASHFMVKSLSAYDSAELLQTMPQVPSELANLSLRCQTEMRACLKLLQELEGAPERGGGRIKNQARRPRLMEPSETITEELEEVAYEQAEQPEVENSTIREYSRLEAVAT